ncbi:MAG: hypothetical protein V1859_03930 [archaeon]
MKKTALYLCIFFLYIAFCNNAFGDVQNMTISNLGVTGFENINNEYTSTITVYLQLNLSPSANRCRFINYDSGIVSLSDNSWSPWEQCIRQKYWQLNNSIGNKTVYVHVNFSNGIQILYNDSIYYHYSGAGLDVTYPSGPVAHLPAYSNNINSLSLSWEKSYDRESEILAIPIIYEVNLYRKSPLCLLNRTNTTGLSTDILDFSDLCPSLANNDKIYATLSAINSARLTNTTTTTDITIDIVPPNRPSVIGNYTRDNIYTYQMAQNGWYSAKSLFFNWTSSDALSGIGAYSYQLTKSLQDSLDNIPEGELGNLYNEKNQTFANIDSGTYFFTVKAKDAAGNWGENYTFNLSIDNSPPIRPVILSEDFNAVLRQVTFNWESKDDESGITNYSINVTNSTGASICDVLGDEAMTERTCSVSSDTYIAVIGARNAAGLWTFSNQAEIITDTIGPLVTNNISATSAFVTDEPIIKLFTDEVSTCMVKIGVGGTYSDFKFTNSTYHETIISLPEGASALYTSCYDKYGNTQGEQTININVNSGASLAAVGIENFSAYQTQLAEIKLNATTPGETLLAGYLPDNFYVAVDGRPIEFSAYDTGNGNYRLKFKAPTSPGNYLLSVNLSGIYSTFNFDTYALMLDTKYNPNVAYPVSASEFIIYSTGDYSTYGIASDSDSLVINQAGFSITSNINDNLFIFSSTKNCNPVSKEQNLKEKSFLSEPIPNFGYYKTSNYFLRMILFYDNIFIDTDNGREYLGQRSFSVVKKASPSGKKGIYIEAEN